MKYDEINIKNLQVFANHGVYPEENVLGQRFDISLTMRVDARPAGKADDLALSVNYGEVSSFITVFMKNNTYKLIEAVAENLAEDMLFLKELNPQMVGIGPFIPHKDTQFANESAGTLELTLFMLGLIRLMLPKVLLPATTALGTIDPNGRELGIMAGANVVMPNLSPLSVREKYMLYNDKISTGDEAAESVEHLKERMKAIGYEIVVSRGDSKNIS